MLKLKNLFQISSSFPKTGKNQNLKRRLKTTPDKNIFCCQKQLERLLTPDIIRKFYAVDFNNVEIEDNQFYGSPEYYTYQFTWVGDKDREARVSLHGVDYGPKCYKIGVGKVERYPDNPLSIFKEYHYNPTTREMAKARKAVYGTNKIKEQFYKEVGILNVTSASDNRYISVANVGDAAYWDNLDGGLDVLTGGVKFQVVVDVCDYLNENQKLARRLANEIIARANK